MAERYERQLAIQKAAELCAILEPAFIRLEVAGSIRRGMDSCKDLELVGVGSIGVRSVGLFDDNEEVNMVTQLVDQLLHDKVLAKRPDEKTGGFHMGEKSMRLLFGALPVDLFVTYDPLNYGLLKMIRTGPYLFSKRIVTPTYMAGLLQAKYMVREGWIRLRKNEERIPTPEEQDVFDCLTVGWTEPKDRVKHGFANKPRKATKNWGSKT